MRLYRGISALEAAPRPRVVTIGVFDGLHAGHEAILARTRAEADAAGESCLVFTFEPTPKEFFSPHNPPPRLTRFRERFERLAALGVDELLCPSFGAVRDIRAEEFVESLIVGELHATHVVVGDDFRYGAGRGGTVADLRAAGERHGFRVTVVEPVYWQGRRVSSTAIREALKLGDLATARGMLGRDYSISGRVVRGLGLGTQLGFPTANVNLKRRLAPVDGIFAARVSGLGSRTARGRRERRHAADDRRQHAAARGADLRLRPRHLRRVHHRALHRAAASGTALRRFARASAPDAPRRRSRESCAKP